MISPRSGAGRGLVILAVCLALLFAAAPQARLRAADQPDPDRPAARVNDYAGLMNQAQRAELERNLAEFERRTTNQLLVATFQNTGGEVP